MRPSGDSGSPQNRLLIGAIGRLSEEKGFDLLIAAVDRLLEQDLDVELRIAGEGDQQEHLASLIRDKGRDDRIRLVGFQAQTIPLYEAMDVFVLSSLREGLPNVVLEAMAMEVPVIATKVAGIPRLIQARTERPADRAGIDPRADRCADHVAGRCLSPGKSCQVSTRDDRAESQLRRADEQDPYALRRVARIAPTFD